MHFYEYDDHIITPWSLCTHLRMRVSSSLALVSLFRAVFTVVLFPETFFFYTASLRKTVWTYEVAKNWKRSLLTYSPCPDHQIVIVRLFLVSVGRRLSPDCLRFVDLAENMVMFDFDKQNLTLIQRVRLCLFRKDLDCENLKLFLKRGLSSRLSISLKVSKPLTDSQLQAPLFINS